MTYTYTRQDACTQVVANLRKLGNNTVPNPEDNDKVDKAIDAVAASLSARDIYTFSDVGQVGPTGGEIEPEAFHDFCLVVGWAVAPRFNMAGDQTVFALAQAAENRLAIIAAPPQTRRTLRVDAALLSRRRGTYNGTIS